MTLLKASAAGAVALYIAASGTAAFGAECRSVAGQVNGQIVTAIRHVEFGRNSMSISGTLDGKRSPRQSLACRPIAKGVYCDVKFQGVIVTIMTNGRRMIESVTTRLLRRN